MNDNNSYIEIINFESCLNVEHELDLEHHDIGMEYLNNFLVDRYGSDYELQLDSLMNDSQREFSIYSESAISKVNDSFTSSMQLNDSVTCVSDGEKSVRSVSPSTNSTYRTPLESLTPEEQTTPTLSPQHCPALIVDKPFACPHDACKKSFKYKWILDRHLLSHKTVKFYQCTYKGCVKSYKSKENLTLHVKNIHLKEKPYSCRFCPSLFSHRNGNLFL